MLSAYSKWERFNLMYQPGRVYVIPPIKDSRVKEKTWLSDADVDVPYDPRAASPPRKRARHVHLEKVESNRGNVLGESAEDTVASLMQQTFRTCTTPSEPAVLIQKDPKLHEGDADLIIFHRKYGVVLVQVKADPEAKTVPNIQKAAKQVLMARESFRNESAGLLNPQAVTMVVALPNFSRDAMQTAQFRFPILKKNPEIDILWGTRDYSSWLQQLPRRQDDVWVSDEAFATAVSRQQLLHRLNQPPEPGQVLREHSGFYRNWLLTPDQAEICLSEHSYLHIWGPPGAGKTLLLMDRAIRWLRQEKVVVIVVGSHQQAYLLGSLGRTALSKADKANNSRLKLFCGNSERRLQRMLDEFLKDGGQDICIIADEVEDDILKVLMLYSQPDIHKKRGKLAAAWSANTFDLQGQRATEGATYKWIQKNLTKCLRCPHYIVRFASRLVAPHEAALVEFPIPAPRCQTSIVKVINHPHHQQEIFKCEKCKEDLYASGIPFEGSYEDPGHLSDWIVLLCGTDGSAEDKNVLKEVLQWLHSLNLKVTWQDTKQVSSIRAAELHIHEERTPLTNVINTPAQRRPPRDVEDKQRERVTGGRDRQNHPVVHLSTADAFQGLEKAGVLMVHHDWRDGTAAAAADIALQERHRRQWCAAATRCQGELVVILLTPSPVAHLLTQNP